MGRQVRPKHTIELMARPTAGLQLTPKPKPKPMPKPPLLPPPAAMLNPASMTSAADTSGGPKVPRGSVRGLLQQALSGPPGKRADKGEGKGTDGAKSEGAGGSSAAKSEGAGGSSSTSWGQSVNTGKDTGKGKGSRNSWRNTGVLGLKI